MLKQYGTTLINLLKILEIIPLIYNILFIIVISLGLFMVHMMIQNVPYSKIDVFLSQFLLISPYIITYFLVQNKNLISILTQFLIINILSIPILWYLKTLRWSDQENANLNILGPNTPLLYFDINITLIYTYSFFIYILILRLCYFNANIDISFIFSKQLIPIIILIICYIPIILFLLLKMKKVKEYLWSRVYNILYSTHVMLVQYPIYFQLSFKVHKFAYALASLILRDDIKQTYIQKIIQPIGRMIHVYPIIPVISLIIIGFLEATITNHLHYFFRILLIYFVLSLLIRGLTSIYKFPFVLAVCFSDFVYRNWKNPHFPEQFWSFFEDDEGLFWFGFDPNLSHEEKEFCSYQQEKYTPNVVETKFAQHAYGERLHKKVIQNPKSSILQTIATNYRLSQFWVRYVHTTTANHIKDSLAQAAQAAHSTQIIPKNMHNGIPFLIQNPLHQAYLLNTNWSYYNALNSPSIRAPAYPVNIYKIENIPLSTVQTPTTFADWIDLNTPMHFESIKNTTNIKVFTGTSKLAQNLTYKTQSSPDVIIYMGDSNIDFGKNLWFGLDLKNLKHSGSGTNMLLNKSYVKYQKTMKYFTLHLKENNMWTPEAQQVCDKLVKSSDIYEEHITVFIQNIKYFEGALPPVRIPENFSTSELTQQALYTYKQGYMMMLAVDSLLKKEKIPLVTNYQISPQILKSASGSFFEEAQNFFNNL